MSNITSTTLLIDVLGGNKKVAAITGATPGAVSGWRKSKFPAATYVVLKGKVQKMGLSAPDTLWSMRPKPKRKAKR
jgi:hypothetical protein